MKSHRKKNYLLENFAPWRIKKTIVFSNKLKKKRKKSKDPYYPKSKILLTNLNFRNKIRNIMKRGNSKSSKANYYLIGPDPNNLNILILRYFGDPFFFFFFFWRSILLKFPHMFTLYKTYQRKN